MVLCEPKATMIVGVPLLFGFPLPYSLNKCVLGVEEARVRKSTGPCPQGAHSLLEKPGYSWINHQAETEVTTPRVRARYSSCSDSVQLKRGQNWAIRER